MNKLLKVFVSVLALGVMTSIPTLQAQPPAGGGGGGGGQGRGRGQQMTPAQQIERLETAVGKLTDDQKTKITAVYEKLAKDVAALSQEDRQTKGRELRTASQKDVRALLTAEQQTKFDAMPQGGRGGGGGGRRGAGGAGGPPPPGN